MNARITLSVPVPDEYSTGTASRRECVPEEANASLAMVAVCAAGGFGAWFVRSRIVLWTNVAHAALFGFNAIEIRTGNVGAHWGVLATSLTYSASNALHVSKGRLVIPSGVGAIFACGSAAYSMYLQQS